MEVEVRAVRLHLAETFVIAREAANHADVVHVAVSHEGATGFGEAAPIDRYDESPNRRSHSSRITPTCSETTRSLSKTSASALPRSPREQAAKAALDAALHDLQGKLLGVPVFRLLGLQRSGPPTSWTIWLGDPDDMARRAEKASTSFRRLKLKLGGGDGLDVERVRAVRAVTDLPLMVDVNEWWSLEEALENLQHLGELGVEYCEQPLPAGDEGGEGAERSLADPDLRRRGLPYARRRRFTAQRSRTASTSSSRSPGESARRFAWRMRRGRFALGVMLGCMLESGLGIAAGCCVAPLCDHVDLDGNLLLREDPRPGSRARGRRPGARSRSGPRRVRLE